MKNFVFISPNFPVNYWQFCRQLRNNGLRVLGIGDQPYDTLLPELKSALHEYYKVGSLENYDEVYRAVAFFISKYGRIDWLESNNEYWLERDAMLDYKADLMRHYAAGSVNSILAALNRFLRMIAREDCRVHRLRIQYQAYSPEEREITAQEYADLVRTARETGRARLALVLQTICATGIRVSELPAITAEAARRGVAVVRCKGKSRRVRIPTSLQKKLLRYMKQHRIAFGPVFVTRSGAPLDRSNIWREMKALCRAAGVSDKKVFPHNFRHLFARTFYRLNKDLAKLADLLGHSSINTTRIYIRTTSAEHRRCLERMRLVL